MTKITVKTTVQAPVEKAWECWNNPSHITQWCFASDDWHAPSASNDLRVGGKLATRMEAKDGSFGFDFEGIYSVVDKHSRIVYGLADGRQVDIVFKAEGNQTQISETFDAETENPLEMQQAGWQAILDNYKKHTESV